MRTLFPSHWSTTTRRIVATSFAFAALLAASSLLFWWSWADGINALARATERFEHQVGPIDPAGWETPAPPTSPAVVALVEEVLAAPRASDQVHACADGKSTPDIEAALRVDPEARFDTIDLLRRALDAGLLRWPRSTNSTQERAVLHVAARAACDGRIAVGRGDLRTAVRDVNLLGRLASILNDDVELTSWIRATVVESRQRSLIRAILQSALPTRADLGAIESAVPHDDLVESAFRAEMHSIVTTHATMAQSPNLERDRTRSAVLGAGRTLHDLAQRLQDTRHLAGMLEALAEDLRRFPRSTAAARAEGLGEFEAALERRFADTDDVGSILAGMMLTGVGDRAKRCLLRVTLRDLTLAAIRARRIGLERGAYPTRLADLMEEAGVDLVHRDPIRWEIRPDGSATLGLSERAEAALADDSPRLDPAAWTLPPPRRGPE